MKHLLKINLSKLIINSFTGEAYMPFCPECKGEMKFDRSSYIYVCQLCGLALTREQYEETRRRGEKAKSEEEERERKRKEYLKWWLSSKK